MQFTHLRAVALSRLLIESVRLELVVKIGFWWGKSFAARHRVGPVFIEPY
jgi:hypothetical protein